MPIPSLNHAQKLHSVVPKAQNATSRLESPSRAPPDGPADARSIHDASRPPRSIPTLQSHTSDGAKRRSFLPQPGELRYTTSRPDQEGIANKQNSQINERKQSSTIESAANSGSSSYSQNASSNQGRLRPRSMYQTSAPQPEQHGIEEKASINQRSHLHKAAETGLNRSQSLRKPGTSNSAASANARSHSRTKSTTTTISSRKTSAETKPQQERPKSLLVPSTSSLRTATKGSTDAAAGAVRSTRIGGLQRSTSVKARPEAVDRPGSNVSIARAETRQQSSTLLSRSDEPTKHDSKAKPRPAFSTLQQHFTPRKTGKAPTSTFLHPPASDVGNDTIPSELVNLQAELLQLHLLHQSSAKVSRQWELSAKRALRRKFEEVTSLYQVMRDTERKSQEQKNVRALREWNGGNTSFALAEHVQILSGPLHELPSLVGPEGRFTRLVAEFEQWITWIEEVWSSREDASQNNMDLESVEGLGDAWKAENAALTRKLTSYSRDLDRLTQPAHGSSIALIVATCKELLGGMLDELQMMQVIEADVVAREKGWVEARLKAIALDIGAHLSAGDIEAWKT